MNESTTNCDFYAVPPWRRRIMARLFPQRRVPPPEDTEGFAPSYLVTGCVCHLDFADRLRVLISGRLRVEIQSKTDAVIRRIESRSVVSVLPPSRASLESQA